MEYKVFEHPTKIEAEKISTYGVLLLSDENEILRVNDVSTDYEAISKFVDSINEVQVNPFHLGEHIERFINDN